MTAPIIVISGIMASGKSTIAQALSERLQKSVHVRGDQFRRFVVSGREEMNTDTPSDEAVRQMHLRQRIAADVSRSYADAGFTVVVQDIYLGQDLAKMVDYLGDAPMYVVVLNPSQAAVEAREAERQQLRGKVGYMPGGISIEVLMNALQQQTPRIGLWLDTSMQSVDETVDDILQRLDEARVGR